MAKIMVPQYVDDLTGDKLGENGTTIEFSFQGHSYEIDLSPENAEKMTNAFGQYIDHARKATTSGRRRRGSSGMTGAGTGPSRDETREARAWLVENGHLSADSRGRISADNWEKYRNRGQLTMTPVEEKPEATKVNGNSQTSTRKTAKAESTADSSS